MTSPLEQLERLVQLKDIGALTDEEFAAEKAKILAGDNPTGVSQVGEGVRRQASAPIAAQEVRGQAPSADGTSQIDDDEVNWNPFDRPADLSAAERLSRYGLIAGGLLVAGDVVLLGALGLNSLTGATLEDGSTYASMLLPSAAFLLLMLAIDAGLTFASWRWRSRWSAIGLLVMALLTTGGSMLEILDGRTIWRVIQLAVGVGAVFFALQAVRGAFWLKAMGGMAGLQAQRTATEREPATRRRWLGLAGVAAVVVAAIAVLSVLSRQGEDPSAGAATVSLGEPSVSAEVAPSAADAPMLALPPLVSGQPFADARRQLIAAGYAPMPINLNAECPGGLCQAYPEVMECSGMGASPDAQLYAPCTLRYRRQADGAWIIVRTTGEYLPDYGQDVEFHDMAVMNAQDQAAVAELEGEYASLPEG